MSLLGRTARDPTGRDQVAVERGLRESLAGLDPDPLFRRRLRSDVMNAWVAERERIGQRPRRQWLSKRMGSLGRASLYSSVAFCAIVAGAMAASSQALPGEPLYALKLRIEELRVEVLPSHFAEELAVTSLGERIQEMERLAASGSMAEALALVPAIERKSGDVERLIEARGGKGSELVGRRLGLVARLVETLPADLRALVAGLMPRLPLAAPVVDVETTEPTSTDEHAAPATLAPAIDPPAAPDAEPNADTLAPASDQTDTGGRDTSGSGDTDKGDDDDDEDEDETDGSQDRGSERDDD